MPAQAQLGEGSLPFLYNDFHGGLNTLDNPFLLADNQARDLSNVQGTTAGAIAKRNGLQTLASPAETLTSLAIAESVSPTVLVGTGSDTAYKITTGGTVTSIGTALSNNPWSIISAPIVSARGPIYMMNGVDSPKYWTGTGNIQTWTNATGGTAVPNGAYMIYNQNQVFVSGVTSTPSRLYWSALADPTNWDPASNTGAGFMDFDPNDGEAITGIGVVGPYVLVGKPRKLWVLINPATAQARKISDNVGIAAHRSIASSSVGTYFLADDRGVYVTNGSKLTPISDQIQPTIDSIQGTRSQAVGACFNAHYYLSLPLGSTTNDTTLDYDEKLGSWWKHSFGSNQFAIWHPISSGQLYSAKATAAKVDECFVPGVWQDNGANFTWTWKGPWQSPTFYRRRRYPTPYFRKRWRQIRLEGLGTVDVYVARDFQQAEILVRSNVFNYTSSLNDLWGGAGSWGVDGTFGNAGTVSRGRIYGGRAVANALSFVFSATSATQDALYEYTMMITDRRDNVVA